MGVNLSVVMPFYDKEEAYLKTWEAIRPQLRSDDELIIVDDHTPNGTGACDCGVVTVIRPEELDEHIYRLNTLRNMGIMHAKHDAILILDPDCIPDPTSLNRAREMYDPSIMVAGRIDKYLQTGKVKRDPRNIGARWIDMEPRPGSEVWGGCMLFSKEKAIIAGLFDEEFNGSWGAEEHEFAHRMFQIGVRLRYEPALSVKHQWHPKWNGGEKRNTELWNKKMLEREVPGFDPKVVVHLIGWERPHYVNQIMRCIFREKIPIKVRFMNQACEKTARALDPWRRRKAVEIVDLPEKLSPAVVRNMSMEKCKADGDEIMIFFDDDMFFYPGLIIGLLKDMHDRPDFHAITGGVIDKQKPRMLGGRIIRNEHRHYSPNSRGLVESEYVSCGVLAVRLDPLVPFDGTYKFGWNDWDWSNILRGEGLKLGCSRDRVAYHRKILGKFGLEDRPDSYEYMVVRYDRDRNGAMGDKFLEKWGYRPKAGAVL